MNEWIEYRDNNAYIHIGELLKLFLKKFWAIMICTVIGVSIMVGYADFLVTPMYKASIKMYVNNSVESNGNITSSDIVAAKNLVSTYSVVLKSRPTIESVLEKTGLNYTNTELSDMIAAKSVNDTEIIRVSVMSKSPEEAATIANAIAEVAPKEIMSVVTGSSVKIVENAEIPTKKASPNTWKYALVGAIVGLILGCALIVIASLRKNGMTVEDKIRQTIKNVILSVIPQLEKNVLCDKLDFASAEAYKLLRTNLTFCLAGNQEHRIVGVTSSLRGEGKSTTSINLAYSLAQLGKKVCLLDCDLRLPSVATKLNLEHRPGLTNVLVGEEKASNILRKCKFESTAFYVITAGDTPPNSSELLESENMKHTVEGLAKVFDYIILDLPPVGMVTDPLVVAETIDGMVLVVGENTYDRRTLANTLRKMEDVKVNLLGLVITHSTSQKKTYKKYGNKYGHYYQ